MKGRMLAFVAVLMLVAGPALAQAPSAAKLDDLMHKSGIWEQIGDVSGYLVAGSRNEEKMPAEQRSLLRAAKEAGYAPDVMRARVRNSFGKRMSAADVDTTLRWLDGETGRKFTQLEVEDTKAPAGSTDGAAQRLYTVLGSDRRGRIERIVKANGNGEGQVKIFMELNIAQAQVFAAATGNASEVDELRRKLESERPARVERARERSLVNHTYMYRSASIGELDSYIEFLESPVGRRYNAAAEAAITEAMIAGGADAAKFVVNARKGGK